MVNNRAWLKTITVVRLIISEVNGNKIEENLKNQPYVFKKNIYNFYCPCFCCLQ